MQDLDLLKETLKKYNKENYHVQTWEEYWPELNSLLTKISKYVKEHNFHVDGIVPLLRGGNVPATFLAYALKVLVIRPVQYKYFFLPGKCELRRLHSLSTSDFSTPNPTLILVEGNHCYGNQAKYAASDIKQLFPDAHLIYGASNMDYKYQQVVTDADISFYGNLTNCCKELSNSECEKHGIVNGYKSELLFPWEHVNEEWDIIEKKQTSYTNVEQLRLSSPLVAEYPL